MTQPTWTDDELALTEIMRRAITSDNNTWLDAARIIITAGRSRQSAAKTTAPEMAAFGASHVACYRWPDDTPNHRLARVAYCEGAHDAVASAAQASNMALEEAVTDFIEATKDSYDSWLLWRLVEIRKAAIRALQSHATEAPGQPDGSLQTHTEVCLNDKCPRGGTPVEVVDHAGTDLTAVAAQMAAVLREIELSPEYADPNWSDNSTMATTVGTARRAYKARAAYEVQQKKGPA